MSEKLDRLVSERVMGWPTIGIDVDVESGGYIRWNTPFRGMDHPTNKCEIWRPSTDIAAAWEVVEQMKKTNAYCDNGNGVMFPSSGLFLGAMEYTPLASMSSKEAATAICVEALRAVGVPESEIQEAMR